MDQYQAQHFGAAFAGLMGLAILIAFVIVVFLIFCMWRIFTKAGMAGPLALLLLLWPIGLIVDLCILAFAEWRVTPIVVAPPYYPPTYPPPPPPPGYPPAPPPTV